MPSQYPTQRIKSGIFKHIFSRQALISWLLVFIYLFLMWQIWIWVKHISISQLANEDKTKIRSYVSLLQGQLEKYEFLPELLSTNRELIEALENPSNPKRIITLNQYLETINRITNASDTYLMDNEGLTIAASNWQSERPFVGRNFSYRPYFQKAMQGKLGRYYALGSTSLRRGYYFAYPVQKNEQILGAIVIKIEIGQLEQSWQNRPEQIMVTDPNGIVFITTNPNWRYRSIDELDPQTKAHIKESRRYPLFDLKPGALLKEREYLDNQIQLYRLSHQADTKAWNKGESEQWYLHTQFDMNEAGWQFHLLSPMKLVYKHLIEVQIIATLVFVAIVLLALFIWQRRKRFLERQRFEELAQATLRRAHNQLEKRVKERTIELQHEIEERRTAEKQLRQTQDQLIQTAKLATIGELSAGISHELNQPLAAIRSYADNARLYLNNDRQEEAIWNLNQIAELTERMAQINSQLKLFARKKSTTFTHVSIVNAIEASRRILRPQIKATETQIHLNVPDNANVWVNEVQFEQVLVNLFANAMNAMQSQDTSDGVVEHWIKLDARIQKEMMLISIHDNGPGILEENMANLFEPFFTTKESGLGLGLSISHRLIQSMNGCLEAANHSQGGAVFNLWLPLSE